MSPLFLSAIQKLKPVALTALAILAGASAFGSGAYETNPLINPLPPLIAPVCKLGTSGVVQAPVGENDARNPLIVVSKRPSEMLSRFYLLTDLVPVPTEDSSPELVDKWKISADPNYHEMVRRPVATAAVAMINYARSEGIDLYVHSGHRDYTTQCKVFNFKMLQEYTHNPALVDGRPADEKIAAQRVNTRSALPGQSEHQLGTAVDFVTYIVSANPLVNGYKLEPEMDQTPAFAWLQQNAYRFGFIMTYPKSPAGATAVNAQTGYVYEPWHWRYVGVRTATNYQVCAAQGLTTQDYLRKLAKNPAFTCAVYSVLTAQSPQVRTFKKLPGEL